MLTPLHYNLRGDEMTEKNAQLEAGLASDLNRELDCGIAIDDKREVLAELAHAQWSGWMEYLFSKGVVNEDGTWTMPAWAVERWRRQMKTSYNELSFDEKESDRKEADKFLAVLCI